MLTNTARSWVLTGGLALLVFAVVVLAGGNDGASYVVAAVFVLAVVAGEILRVALRRRRDG
jgi:hypothetical protein